MGTRAERIELAWVEHALPGADTAGRVRLAGELDLALEVASRPELDVRALVDARARVVCVQAYGLRDDPPLHPDAQRRARAALHLDAALELAARLRAPRVVAVCAYGRASAPTGTSETSETAGDAPGEVASAAAFERCCDFFGARAGRARDLGVRILIEPLSPLRADAFTDPADVARLIRELGAPDVFGAVLDTGHLLDAGRDPLAVLAAFDAPVDELQLRGRDSRAPTGAEPLAAWLAALPRLPALVAVEYREAVGVERVRTLVPGLLSVLAAARSARTSRS